MNEKYISRSEMQTLIDNAPKKFTADDTLQKFASRGYSIEGYNDQPKLVEKTLASNIGSDLSKRGSAVVAEVKDAVSDVKNNIQNPTSIDLTQPNRITQAGRRVVGQGAAAITDTIGNVASSVAGAADDATGNVASTAAKSVGNFILDTEIGKTGLRFAQQGLEQYDSWKAQNPEQAKDLEAIVNIASVIPVAKGAKIAISGVESAAKGVARGTVATADAVGNVVKPVVNAITPDAEKIMQRVARVSKTKQASFETKAGETIGSFLDKRGIYGDIEQISEKLYNNFKTSKNNADEALSKLKGTYQPEQVKTALNQLEGYFNDVSAPGAIPKEVGEISSLINKFKKDGLNMTEINQVKRIFERNVKLDFLKSNNNKGVVQANNIDNAIREWQFGKANELGLKNLPEINKETMLSKQLLDDIGKEYSGTAGNNAINITDWIVLSGGDPTAIGTFLVKQTLSSKKVQSAVAKKVSKNKIKINPSAGIFEKP